MGKSNHRLATIAFHRSAVEKAIALMQRAPAAAVDLETLSQHCGISACHFSRVFREVTQYSPHRFLVAVRLQMAKRILAETGGNIVHVCSQVGYDSATTFARVFKKHVGITPAEFKSLASTLSIAQLRSLILECLNRSRNGTKQNDKPVNIQMPQPFTGVAFVCGGGIPVMSSWAELVADQGGRAQFKVPSWVQGSAFSLMAFSDSAEVSHYLLPDERSYFQASVPAGDCTTEEGIIIDLNRPSDFDPPFLACVPALLLSFSNAKCANVSPFQSSRDKNSQPLSKSGESVDPNRQQRRT